MSSRTPPICHVPGEHAAGGGDGARGERDHQHAARVPAGRDATGGEIDQQPGDAKRGNDPAQLDVAQVEIGPHRAKDGSSAWFDS